MKHDSHVQQKAKTRSSPGLFESGGQQWKETPEKTTVLVHTADTGGTGSLIKNTAPFQQLWLGPKWTHTE